MPRMAISWTVETATKFLMVLILPENCTNLILSPIGNVSGGSRKGKLKGGDIDLLLVMHSSASKRRIGVERASILSAWKQKIGDRKIDLALAETDEIENDPFLKNAFKTGILLKKW